MPFDLSHALRVLRRAPALTAALVLSLGLGTGANAAVFNLISALMLRPPPDLAEPGELITLKRNDAGAGMGLSSPAEFLALKQTTGLTALSAYEDATVTGAAIGRNTYRVRVAKVAEDFFETLGMQASIGRLIRDGDANAAVISHPLWQSAGSDAEIAGKTITIEGRAVTIAGVLPPRFQGLHVGRTTGVWIRLAPDAAGANERTLSVIGRARDIAAAEAAAPGFDVDRYGFLDPSMQAQTSLLSAVLMGATLLVLVCACVNAASLLLSRGNARRKDFAVKLALGAGRARLMSQLLLENALTGLAGGAVALLFAYWTSSIVPSLFAPEHAEMLDARISAGILAATLAGTTLLGIALGVLPALYATAPATLLDLRGDAGSISETGPGTRVQLQLVIVQIALSTVLLVGALLLNKSLRDALEGDLGIGARNVAVATLAEPGMGFSFNPAKGMPSYRIAVEQARKIPGVTGAGLASTLPLGPTARSVFGIETAPGIIERIEMDTNVVSLTYFNAMQTPVFMGRGFRETDTAREQQVAIVNDIALRRFFGGTAVGRKLIDARGDEIEVIGVVPSGRYRTMQETPAPMVYRPLTQIYLPRMHVVVRTSEDPDAMLEALTPAMNVVYLELRRLATLDTHLEESLVLDRFAGILVTACGAMALVLAIIGAYSVMLDSVQRRTREIGLRIALGAGALRIGRSVFIFGFALAGAGLAVGLVLTLVAERVAKYFVFGLPGIDLVMVAITAGILLLVVALAAILPARRALRVSPTVALRHT